MNILRSNWRNVAAFTAALQAGLGALIQAGGKPYAED